MIISQKTLIRPIEREELSLIRKWYNDDEVMHWASGGRPGLEYSLDYLEEVWFEEIYSDANARMMIETRDEKKPIGIIGFREKNSQERRCKLIVFIGDKEYWGKGYGTDAVYAFLWFLFNRWNLNRVELDTFEGNERAIKCYEKCGFKIEGRLRKARFVDGEYKDEIIMGILKDEFKAIEEADGGKKQC